MKVRLGCSCWCVIVCCCCGPCTGVDESLFLHLQAFSGQSSGLVVGAKAEQMPTTQPEAGSSEGSSSTALLDKPVVEHTDAALGAALLLTPQAKGKPIEELSAEEANDMTCAICLDQIPVAELCAIKGCDHVYCGMQHLPLCNVIHLRCPQMYTLTLGMFSAKVAGVRGILPACHDGFSVSESKSGFWPQQKCSLMV